MRVGQKSVIMGVKLGGGGMIMCVCVCVWWAGDGMSDFIGIGDEEEEVKGEEG